MYTDVQAVLAQIQKNRHWYLLLGIGLVVLGTLAILFSFRATLFSVIYLAWLLLLVGVAQAIQAFKMHTWSKFSLHLLLAFLYLASGVFILMNPLLNAITLTWLLAAFFVVAGLFKVVFAVWHSLPHRGWIIFSGILSVLLGVLIWQQWPVSGLWVIGLFVGIDALMTGWSWIVLSLSIPKLKES